MFASAPMIKKWNENGGNFVGPTFGSYAELVASGYTGQGPGSRELYLENGEARIAEYEEGIGWVTTSDVVELAQTSDLQFCDTVRGLKFGTELQTTITDMGKPGDLMVHVPTFCIISGTVYATYYANTTTSAEDPTKHVARFCYFDLATPETKTFVDLCTVGTVISGKTVTKIYDTILLKKYNQTLYLMWTVEMGGHYYRVYRTFDVATKVVGATTSINAFTTSPPISFTYDKNISLGSVGIGGTVNLTPESVVGYGHAIVDCSPGDIFTVNGIGGSNPRLWGFVDANNVLLSMAAVNATGENLQLTAPANAAKLIINTQYPTEVASYIGVVNSFDVPGMQAALKAKSIKSRTMDGDIGIMQRLTSLVVEGKTYYYTGCYVGAFNCIIRSVDLITWEYVAQPTFKMDPIWENAVYVSGTDVLYFVRQQSDKNYGILSAYSLETKKWRDPVRVNDCQSRGDFFTFNGKVYLIHAPYDRDHLSILEVNKLKLAYSKDLQTARSTQSFYPFVQVSGSDVYIAYTQARLHIYLAKISVGSIADSTILAKQAELMAGILS